MDANGAAQGGCLSRGSSLIRVHWRPFLVELNNQQKTIPSSSSNHSDRRHYRLVNTVHLPEARQGVSGFETGGVYSRNHSRGVTDVAVRVADVGARADSGMASVGSRRW